MTAASPRIIVGLTTSPDRVRYLDGVLASLANQLLKPETVYVVVTPNKTATDGGTDYRKFVKSVARALKKSPLPRGVGKVLLADEDYGSASKLIGPLLMLSRNKGRESDNNVYLVTVNDDKLYGPRLLQDLLDGHYKHPNSAVCLFGHVLGNFPNYWAMSCSNKKMGNRFWETVCIKANTRVDVVCSSSGVLYPSSIFCRKMMADATPPASCDVIPNGLMEDLRKNKIKGLHELDDLYISAWLDLLGVAKYVVKSSEVYNDNSNNNNNNDKQLQSMHSNLKHLSNLCSAIYALRNLGLLRSGLDIKWYQSAVNLVGIVGILVIIAISATTLYVYHKDK